MPPISQLHSAGRRVDVAGGVAGAHEQLVLAEDQVLVTVIADAHGGKKRFSTASSSAHSKVTPVRLEPKTNVAVRALGHLLRARR